jgi:hypothetical protein
MALGLTIEQSSGVDAYYWRIDVITLHRSDKIVDGCLTGYKDAAAAAADKDAIEGAVWNFKFDATHWDDFDGAVDVREVAYNKVDDDAHWAGAIEV